jgi:hypothetical protein
VCWLSLLFDELSHHLLEVLLLNRCYARLFFSFGPLLFLSSGLPVVFAALPAPLAALTSDERRRPLMVSVASDHDFDFAITTPSHNV